MQTLQCLGCQRKETIEIGRHIGWWTVHLPADLDPYLQISICPECAPSLFVNDDLEATFDRVRGALFVRGQWKSTDGE